MELTFYGAAKMVTGSCHCLKVNGKNYLIDCGLKQGMGESNNSELHFNAGEIEAVIVTHAHIDHSGRLPFLVRQGFNGKIYTTRQTAKLLSIMLLDSAHIQESDALYENKRRSRSGGEPVEPLYTLEDAQKTLERLVGFDYGQTVDLGPGIKITFTDAGHLLGSAIVRAQISESGTEKTVIFSGDLGNTNQPIIRNPQPVSEGDYLVIESTYGDRQHQRNRDYQEELAVIIDKTMRRGGNVIIPAFAVGRTQELLYNIREIKEKQLVKSMPHFNVWVDSPLANEATMIYDGDLTGYLDEESIARIKKGSLLQFDGLHLSTTLDESKALNKSETPNVIISASGMCDAGRIRHHLKHNLWRPECTVVFVGFQAEGTLGRSLVEGIKEVKLFGEKIVVKAEIVNLKGLSSHADRDALLNWACAFIQKPQEVFVVHGEASVTEIFAATLREKGFSAHAPEFREVYDLAANKVLEQGIPQEAPAPAPIRKVPAARRVPETPGFQRLLEAGKLLMEIIESKRGANKKEIRQLTREIKALLRDWQR